MTLAGTRLLLTTDAVGGVWTYTLDLAEGLAGAGVAVRIAVLGPALRPDQRDDVARRRLDVDELHQPLEWLAADPAEVRGAACAIALVAREWGADLVHLHSPAFAVAATFGCPVVATNHSCVGTWWAAVQGGELPPDLRWRAALVGEGLRRADLVLAPSRAYAADVAAIYGLTGVPLAVHNGRAATHVDASTAAAEHDAVFTAGRLWDSGKNIAALDATAALLPWPVRAAGDIAGPDGSRMTFSHIDLLGRQPEAAIRAHLADRPIYVAPARFEPFGLAVLEAAQAGCALVLNDIATFRELWEGAALFVDADDARALAAAVCTLIEDRAGRRGLGEAARAHARHYTLAAMVEATVAAYARCLVRRPVALSA